MNPTLQATQQISNYVSGSIAGAFTNNDPTLVGDLNNPFYQTNPTPQGQVYKTYTSAGLASLTASGLLNTISYIPDYGSVIVPILDTQPKTAAVLQPLMNWLLRMSGANIFSTQIFIGATGYLFTTVPDPNYVSGVSWAQANIGRAADLGDMASARNYYNSH